MNKKNILFIAILFIISTVAAQVTVNQTIGLRLGDDNGLGAEISYQHPLVDNTRLEAGLAWHNSSEVSAFKVSATHQWIWDLGSDENFNWYAGVGGGFASWSLNSTIKDNGTFLFLAGDIGIEYKFDFPLILSLDTRPEFGFSKFNDGLDFDIALGIRYVLD